MSEYGYYTKNSNGGVGVIFGLILILIGLLIYSCGKADQYQQDQPHEDRNGGSSTKHRDNTVGATPGFIIPMVIHELR
jgi:hypothetical protein